MSTGAIALFSLVMLLLLIFCGVHLSTSLMFTSTVSVFLFTERFSTAMNVLSQSAWGGWPICREPARISTMRPVCCLKECAAG